MIKTLFENASTFQRVNKTSSGLPGASTFAHAITGKRGNRIILGIGLNSSNNDVMQGDALGIVTPVTPLTGASQSFNVRGCDELLYLTPAGTIAADTIVFPADNQSRIGQTLTVLSSQIVTALTVTGTNLTLNGLAASALAANIPVTWKKTAAATWQRIDATGTQSSGVNIDSIQSLSGAGAVDVVTTTTRLTTTGAGQALTLANGAAGQIKRIIHEVDGGSAVLTPTTKTGFTTITFTAVGDSCMLEYLATRGWMIVALNGAVAA